MYKLLFVIALFITNGLYSLHENLNEHPAPYVLDVSHVGFGGELTDEILDKIQSVEQEVEELVMRGYSIKTNEQISKFNQILSLSFPKLKKLDLLKTSVQNLTFTSEFAPNLEVLIFDRLVHPGFESIIVGMHTLQNLKYLQLGAISLSRATLASFTTLKNLEYLELNKVSSIGIGSLHNLDISAFAPNLKSLSLKNTSGQDVTFSIAGLKNIEKLDLSNTERGFFKGDFT